MRIPILTPLVTQSVILDEILVWASFFCKTGLSNAYLIKLFSGFNKIMKELN